MLCILGRGSVLHGANTRIALGPSGMVSDITKKYCRSLAEWAMWPALYAMFCTLMVAIQMGNVSAVLGQSNGLPAGIGDPATNNSITLVLTSLLYGVCIIIIPFIAHYVIGGSFAGVAAGIATAIKAGLLLRQAVHLHQQWPPEVAQEVEQAELAAAASAGIGRRRDSIYSPVRRRQLDISTTIKNARTHAARSQSPASTSV
jgi:hypothetical protein